MKSSRLSADWVQAANKLCLTSSRNIDRVSKPSFTARRVHQEYCTWEVKREAGALNQCCRNRLIPERQGAAKCPCGTSPRECCYRPSSIVTRARHSFSYRLNWSTATGTKLPRFHQVVKRSKGTGAQGSLKSFRKTIRSRHPERPRNASVMECGPSASTAPWSRASSRQRKGCSLFPFSGRTLTTLADDAFAAYEQTKGSLYFDLGKALPVCIGPSAHQHAHLPRRRAPKPPSRGVAPALRRR